MNQIKVKFFLKKYLRVKKNASLARMKCTYSACNYMTGSEELGRKVKSDQTHSDNNIRLNTVQ